MKKLSFFLMAMLFSVMSFAQEAPVYELVPAAGSNNAYASNCDVTIDGITWNITGNSTMIPWRIGGKKLTNQDRALYSKTPLGYNINKIEVTHGTASSITVNSFKLIISDEPNGTGETIDVAFKASATTTINLPEGDHSNKYFKFLYNVTVGNDNKFIQFTNAKFYAALAADAVKAPIIDGDADFISETEVTIEADNDVTVYYTVDGTEPTNASTVYTAPFTVEETTTVKAIAYRGEKASFVTSATFTKATQLTCAEAAVEAMKVASNNAPTALTYVVYGYVTEVIDQTLSNGQQRFWVADTKNGGQVLQSYYCNVPQVLKVGDYVQMFGKLTKYNSNPQMKNGDVTLAEEPVIVEPTIECKDALDFGAVVYTDEVEGQTLEVTGYNLTSDITVTLSDDVFAVDQTTLPAEGGELVVTPVSPLAAGTHTATLTLTSGEATAEVTLTIVAKDVYTITWSVNGETSTTSVVEGDKLALPTAPEAPEACSEKVFVGWTAAEEVNADGSDIEWVTATTVPTDDATYYAVFALASGEGGLSEVVDVLDRALTGVEGTNYASWSDKTANSDAVYAGQSAGGNESIQLRSNNSNSGVISTTSGGKLAKVTVAWNSNTASGRTLNIYGSNSAYTAPTDLYGNASGEKLGTIVCGTSTELVIEGDYAYVGLRSNSGAMYLDEIQITWTSGAAVTYTDYSTTCVAPVVPETITWELNGGVLPAPAVPTQEELWASFKTATGLDTKALSELSSPVLNTIAGLLKNINKWYEGFDVLEWKWLKSYIQTIQANQAGQQFVDANGTTRTVVELKDDISSDDNWRFAVAAFFAQSQYVGWPAASADFSEAGKPENWGAAYEAAHAVVLPTEPVAEDYVLPTPVKEGYTFVGWYDNAEGTGKAYTVIPAGWAGTLYAIWKQGTTTALENIAVEGKAVKAIINGQLIIIKNGVQYNAQGQVVK